MEEQPPPKQERPGKHINPNLSTRAVRLFPPSEYVDGILAGNRQMLSRAITLIESTRPDHQEIAQQILEKCLEKDPGPSIRIGVTGSPGVGKSTFIDGFGRHLLQRGRKLAVLTIDPSSRISKGSILGDKTRMEELSKDERVFIRPSPAGESLGGVAQKSRETILLCETAGFNTIIVETVGVGQSETAVRALADFFLLLLQPGAGDELQGLKRGIVEMADLLVVNKTDGPSAGPAKKTRQAYQQALHLLAPKASGWPVQVVNCSALEGTGLAETWKLMLDFCTFTQENGFWQKNRREQARHWFHQSLTEHLQQLFYQHPAVRKELSLIERSVAGGRLSPFRAAKTLIRLFIEAKT